MNSRYSVTDNVIYFLAHPVYYKCQRWRFLLWSGGALLSLTSFPPETADVVWPINRNPVVYIYCCSADVTDESYIVRSTIQYNYPEQLIERWDIIFSSDSDAACIIILDDLTCIHFADCRLDLISVTAILRTVTHFF